MEWLLGAWRVCEGVLNGCWDCRGGHEVVARYVDVHGGQVEGSQRGIEWFLGHKGDMEWLLVAQRVYRGV